MKFICFGYADPSFFASTPEKELHAMQDRCFEYDDQLRSAGHFTGGHAVQPPSAGMTLRYENGKVVATKEPVTDTKEQIGGILILEARDLNHAVELISKHPGVTFGPWEIRPAADLDEMIRASEIRRSKA